MALSGEDLVDLHYAKSLLEHPSLAARLSGVNEYLAPFAPEGFNFISWTPPETWKANWKLN